MLKNIFSCYNFNMPRFFVPGASGVRHPFYDYQNQRFYATSLNLRNTKNKFSLNVNPFTVTKGKYN